MEISAQGLAFLKQSEGFSGRVYDDAGKQAIGYGHDLKTGEDFPGGVTQAEAELMLKADLQTVYASLEQLVKVPLTQGQYDALCSFVYNLGPTRLAGSTLLKKLNAKLYADAANELLRWDMVQGVHSPGLRRRREGEYKMWIAQPNDRPRSNDL